MDMVHSGVSATRSKQDKMIIVDDDDDSSSSSGQSLGNGEDDDPDAIMPEEPSDDEDYDETIGTDYRIKDAKGIAPQKSIES